ncbi:MAG: arginine-tRNA-protein transferase [Acidobacteria bacterium]|nr:arginine-tRNA-protein transferase [Acidobacteriota bacterium]MBI3421498.1 arginine-tRNA-protein transferase [Acidobacteriota bacterium]
MLDQAFRAHSTQPAEMDLLWANGWRHFGAYFFRYSLAEHGGRICSVIPLRVDLERFAPSRSQKRALARNRDLTVIIRDSFIDEEKEALFNRHRVRFTDNVPDSLYTFLSRQPARMPCQNQEICVYDGARLLAASFLDLGETATSAVYAVFEPEEHKRSLGIFTMLRAIEYSRELGCRYYYPGYAYREPSVYDYKKNFAALEYLDWSEGWQQFNHDNQ